MIFFEKMSKNERKKIIHFDLPSYRLTILVGMSDSLIHSFLLGTSGIILREIDSSLALADLRSILNAVCSLTILYLVWSGRRNFVIVFVDFSNDFAGTRTNFFDPILMSDLDVFMAFGTEDLVCIFGGSAVFGLI